MSQIIGNLIVIVCSMLLSMTAQATEKLTCATNEFAPFGFTENDTLTGIEVDLVQEIAHRLKFDISLTMMPWKRMLQFMEDGTIDCMFAAFKTPEREVYMDYTSVPIHISSLVFFEKDGSHIKFETLEDLKGLTVGLVRGFKTNEAFDAAVSKGVFRVDEVNNFDQNFKKLSAGRVDLVLVNRHVGGRILKKLGITNVHPLPVPLSATPAYLTFSKKRQHADLVSLFDIELKKASSDGTYRKIFEKYIQN